MTAVLVRKLLRDLRVALIVVAVLLAAFQCLWARITERILGDLSPFFRRLAAFGGLTEKNVQEKLFEGPGKLISTLIGGESLTLNSAMDFLSVAYVHPLMITIFCIWAIGRAAGAIAGETDRGTAELLLAQPLPRSRVILAHFWVDLITIPLLCLSLWFGTWLGTSLMGPIHEKEDPVIDVQGQAISQAMQDEKIKLGLPPGVAESLERLLKARVEERIKEKLEERPQAKSKRLEVRPLDFGWALWAVGGLMFAVSGYTMWISSLGRFRWRVLGVAVVITLVMFLINLIGQMWDRMAPLRPLTIFYYYEPQPLILGKRSNVTLAEWNHGKPLVELPSLVVLYTVGAVGYLLALRTFRRRDIPAPL
jgi:ABC-2 type transport system permease protein